MKFTTAVLFATALLSQYKLVSSHSFPDCTGTTVYATSSDGKAWGWENDSFCRIRSSSGSSSSGSSSSGSSSSGSSSSGSSDSAAATTTAAPAATSAAAATETSSAGILEQASETASAAASSAGAAVATGVAAAGSAVAGAAGAAAGAVAGAAGAATSAVANAAGSATSAVSAALSKPTGDANGNAPFCTGCVVVSTGGDGALWGKENNAVCKINANICNGKLTNVNGGNANPTSAAGKVSTNLYAAAAAVVALVAYAL